MDNWPVIGASESIWWKFVLHNIVRRKVQRSCLIKGVKIELYGRISYICQKEKRNNILCISIQTYYHTQKSGFELKIHVATRI
jgi:hypothetical protein